MSNLTDDRQTFPWLDWLRFAAAFVVLMVHTRDASFVPFGNLSSQGLIEKLFYAVTTAGLEAVIVFFVLSGYFVGGRLIERLRAGTFNGADYAIDRATRLYVPLIPALVLTAFAYLVMTQEADWPSILGSTIFLQDVVVDAPALNLALWSLSYEFWFYAIAGLVGMAVTTRRSAWLLLAGLALLVFTVLEPLYLLCWLIGTAAYCSQPAKASVRGMFAAALISIVALGLSLTATSNVSISWAPAQDTVILGLAVAVAFLIQQLAAARRTSSTTLDRLGSSLAAFSYTLYLTHLPVLHYLTSFGFGQQSAVGLSSLSVYVMKIATCLAAAWAIYLLSERHTHAVRSFAKSLVRPTRRTLAAAE